ncbi:MAG: hypothetical protein ACRC78_02675 [Planktothrix sp.]
MDNVEQNIFYWIASGIMLTQKEVVMTRLTNRGEQEVLEYIRSNQISFGGTSRNFYLYFSDPGENPGSAQVSLILTSVNASTVYNSTTDLWEFLYPNNISGISGAIGNINFGVVGTNSNEYIFRVQFTPALSVVNGQNILIPANSLLFALSNCGQILSDRILSRFFNNGSTLTGIGNLSIGLFSSLTLNGSGTEITSSLGLTRTPLPQGSSSWSPPSGGATQYNAIVSLGIPTVNGTINHLGFFDSSANFMFRISPLQPISAIAGEPLLVILNLSAD